MEEAPMFTIPTIDLSAKSLLTLFQLGVFVVFAYWAVEGGIEDNFDYLFLVVMGGAGLALFLSVPNARMGATLGVPAAMVVMMVAMGEAEDAIWAVFMMAMIGPIAYMPAMATADPTLGLDDETRLQRLGILWVVFVLFMMLFMVGLADLAMEGELTEEDNDGTEYTVTLDSTQQTIAQGGLAVGVIGVLVFLLTAVMGREVGSMRPWHGGAMAAAALLIAGYLSITGEGAPAESPMDFLMILCMLGIIALTPCVAYEGSEAAESE